MEDSEGPQAVCLEVGSIPVISVLSRKEVRQALKAKSKNSFPRLNPRMHESDVPQNKDLNVPGMTEAMSNSIQSGGASVVVSNLREHLRPGLLGGDG